MVVIPLGFLVTFFVWAVATHIGLKSLSHVSAEFRAVVEGNNVKAMALAEMRKTIRERMLIVHEVVHRNDPFLAAERWGTYTNWAGRFVAARERFLEQGITPNSAPKSARSARSSVRLRPCWTA